MAPQTNTQLQDSTQVLAEITRIGRDYPNRAFALLKQRTTEPWAKEAAEGIIGAQKYMSQPEVAFRHADILFAMDRSWAKTLLENVRRRPVKGELPSVVENEYEEVGATEVKRHYPKLSQLDPAWASVQRNIATAILNDEASELLETAKNNKDSDPKKSITAIGELAKSYPKDFLVNFTEIKSIPQSKELLLDILKESPWLVIVDLATKFSSSVPEADSIAEVISSAPQYNGPAAISVAKQFVTSKASIDVADHMWVLLPEVQNGGIDPKTALAITSNDALYLKKLFSIRPENISSHQSRFEHLLANSALTFLRKVNDLQLETEETQFALVKGFSAAGLFKLMTIGSEEVHARTFRGLYSRFIEEVGREKISLSEILFKDVDLLRTFIRLTATYGKLEDFFTRLDSKDDRREIIKQAFSGIDRSQNKIAQFATLVDLLGFLTDKRDQKSAADTISTELAAARKSGDSSNDLFTTLLATRYSELFPKSDLRMEQLSKGFSGKFSTRETISQNDLFSNGIMTQRYFFYDDKDGVASHAHFLSQYQGKSNWKVENRGAFSEITSVGYSKTIRIFANNPTKEEEGNGAIDKLFASKKIDPTMIVHRGHNTHAESTIRRIPPTAKIVHLGSCGGYSRLSDVLDRALGAQIISTKAVGTMAVNDAILSNLNQELLRQESTFSWQKFWSGLSGNLRNNTDFASYTAPHLNVALTYIYAYKKATEGRQ